MASLSGWVMSIAGIICLSVLIELILPNGQMNKYIKGIFSFVIVLVIISPIPKLLGRQFDYDSMFGKSEIVLQEDYLEQFNYSRLNALQTSINRQVEALGYNGVSVRLDCNIFESTFAVKAAYVDLKGLCISENARHKDILEVKADILDIVTGTIKLQKERVVFNE